MFVDGVTEPWGELIAQITSAWPLGVRGFLSREPTCVPERPALDCASQILRGD